MEKVYTVQEIIDLVQALDAKAAASHTNGHLARLCSTPVIEAIQTEDGQVHHLQRDAEGRWCACYCRVSTEKQAKKHQYDDGSYSIEDQVRRALRVALESSFAVKFYSDAGLSGGLPFNHPALIQEMREEKGRRYQSAFEAVFLKNPDYSDADRQAMRDFMEKEVRRLALGQTRTWDGVEREALPAAEQERKRRGRSRKDQTAFRPALTLVMQELPRVHTLVVLDLSRVSRSYEIVKHVVRALYKHQVRVLGTLTDLSLINDNRDQGEFLTMVMGWLDGMKLKEVVVQVLRSAETMLLTRRPYAKTPTWIKLAADGTAVVDEEKARCLREMVRRYLAGQGYAAIANQFNREMVPSPYGRAWRPQTVKKILFSEHLRGQVEMFGKTWPLWDAIISPEEAYLIDQMRGEKRERYEQDTNPLRPVYLAQGLIKCHADCNKVLISRRNNNFLQYACQVHQHARAEHSSPHLSLSYKDVDRFLNDLVHFYGLDLLRHLDATSEVKRLTDELHVLRARQAEVQRAEWEAAQRLRPKAAETIKGLGVDESEADFQALVERRLQALLKPYQSEGQQVRTEIQRHQQTLEALVPTQQLSAQMEQWDNLTGLEKNGLLKGIFSHFQVVGEAPHEALVPVLRVPTAHPLPPIPLITRKNGKGWSRRLPQVEDWAFVRSLGVHKYERFAARGKLLHAADQGDPGAMLQIALEDAVEASAA